MADSKEKDLYRLNPFMDQVVSSEGYKTNDDVPMGLYPFMESGRSHEEVWLPVRMTRVKSQSLMESVVLMLA
jgi:hypothetical protein